MSPSKRPLLILCLLALEPACSDRNVIATSDATADATRQPDVAGPDMGGLDVSAPDLALTDRARPGRYRCDGNLLQERGPGGGWNDIGTCGVGGPDGTQCLLSFPGASITVPFLRWDGTKWGATGSACLPAAPTAITGFAANDVWLSGIGADGAAVYHWDGKWWTERARFPDVFFNGIAHDTQGTLYLCGARTVDAVIGAGSAARVFSSGDHGQSWNDISPKLDAELIALADGAAGKVWAVGARHLAAGTEAVALLWDGATWQSLPTVPGEVFHAAWSFADSDTWVLGGKKLFRWNGQAWESHAYPQGAGVPPPDDSQTSGTWGLKIPASLYGFAPDNIVAAAGKPIRWDGAQWSVMGNWEDIGGTLVDGLWTDGDQELLAFRGAAGCSNWVGGTSFHTWQAGAWEAVTTNIGVLVGFDGTHAWGLSLKDLWLISLMHGHGAC